MKIIFFIVFASISISAHAGVLRGSPAANLIRALISLDVPQSSDSLTIFLRIHSADCDHDSGYSDDSNSIIWGMGHRTCLMNSVELARPQSELLMKAMGEACFQTDAAQGHWMSSVTNLECKIQLRELVNEKRFICTFDGEQPDPLACASYN